MEGILLLVLAVAASPPGAPVETACVACHRQLGDELAAPVAEGAEGAHAEHGIGCEGCHGGDPDPALAEDPERAMDRAKGYLGAPERSGTAEFCGRCHSSAEFMRRFNPAARIDQVAEYRTSRHGLRNRAGDPQTATCTDCHGAHGILPVKHPRSPVHPLRVAQTCGRCHANPAYMQGRGLPTDQLEKFRTSVHGTALLERKDTSAPACNDCHGNHGAAPPGVTSVAFVCGQCHARVGGLFRESPKKQIFDDLELAECSTCHGVHDIREPGDSMAGIGEGSVCAECHTAEDDGGRTAEGFERTLSNLAGAIRGAEAILDAAERAGMEVSQTRFGFQEARNGLVNARVLVHTFDLAQVETAAREAAVIAGRARAEGEAAMAELQFRRKGLASSLIVILLVITGLVWKIRRIGRPPAA